MTHRDRPRDRRRLAQVLWPKAFGPGGGRPNACGRGPRLAMPRIATPRAPGRKPQPESMGKPSLWVNIKDF